MRRSWGYAFIVLSILIGFSALVLPTPDTVVFEAQEAPVAKKAPVKSAAKTKGNARAQAKGKNAPEPQPEPPKPVMPTKNTVSARVTR
jgi:hypothetical protein